MLGDIEVKVNGIPIGGMTSNVIVRAILDYEEFPDAKAPVNALETGSPSAPTSAATLAG